MRILFPSLVVSDGLAPASKGSTHNEVRYEPACGYTDHDASDQAENFGDKDAPVE